MSIPTRQNLFQSLFPTEKPFRLRQIEEALFKPETVHSWEQASALPKQTREIIQKELPWFTVKATHLLQSQRKDTYKALLELADGQKIETVLMQNKRDQWTICVSSQVGCAMKCSFCATGKMGLLRSLTADEIVDQYRFWQDFLLKNPQEMQRNQALPQRISNVVFMGMGEPLANYENVKTALKTWLKHTDLGPTHITVSTVGLLPALENLLKDSAWPPVRLAISLHSADPVTRKEIVPTSFDQFLPNLKDWTARYLKKFGNRRHHLTFEYVMLKSVNDTDAHAQKLASLASELGKVKVNLIPYNFIGGPFERSLNDQIEHFKATLEAADVPVTIRRTMGDDIAAACGQLITLRGH